MLAGGDDRCCASPRALGDGLVVLEVRRIPREALAQRVPVDAELPADLLLADLPLAALDELQDDDRPAHGDRRSITPNAALLLPLPSPVLTSSSDTARSIPSGRGSSVGGVTPLARANRARPPTIRPPLSSKIIGRHAVERAGEFDSREAEAVDELLGVEALELEGQALRARASEIEHGFVKDQAAAHERPLAALDPHQVVGQQLVVGSTPFSTMIPGLIDAIVATWCGAVSSFKQVGEVHVGA